MSSSIPSMSFFAARGGRLSPPRALPGFIYPPLSMSAGADAPRDPASAFDRRQFQSNIDLARFDLAICGSGFDLPRTRANPSSDIRRQSRPTGQKIQSGAIRSALSFLRCFYLYSACWSQCGYWSPHPHWGASAFQDRRPDCRSAKLYSEKPYLSFLENAYFMRAAIMSQINASAAEAEKTGCV